MKTQELVKLLKKINAAFLEKEAVITYSIAQLPNSSFRFQDIKQKFQQEL